MGLTQQHARARCGTEWKGIVYSVRIGPPQPIHQRIVTIRVNNWTSVLKNLTYLSVRACALPFPTVKSAAPRSPRSQPNEAAAACTSGKTSKRFSNPTSLRVCTTNLEGLTSFNDPPCCFVEVRKR